MPKMQTKEKPVSRKLDRQVTKIVNELFIEAYCAGGCNRRMSIHDMETDVETGKSYCDECSEKSFRALTTQSARV